MDKAVDSWAGSRGCVSTIFKWFSFLEYKVAGEIFSGGPAILIFL